MSDTDDIEATGSTTRKLRAVTSKLKEQMIREEYESKQQQQIADLVFTLDKRVDKIEWWIGAVKWIGGPAVLGLLGLIMEAVFGWFKTGS